MRGRARRRHEAERHMWRRLKEDRNQHYNDLACACYRPGKAMARFKEQPPKPKCYCCCNVRRNDWQPAWERLTMQERRFLEEPADLAEMEHHRAVVVDEWTVPRLAPQAAC